MSFAGFVQDSLALVEAHRAWAGPIMFALAFCESLAVVSLVVPATSILAGAGALLGLGTIAWTAVLWAAAGATLGDAVSYWVGLWLGPDARRVWPFRNDPELFDRAHHLFARYGVFAVFIGRFFGPLRALVPLAAGVTAMPQLRFQVANLLSALVWAPAIMMPGAALGMGFGALSVEDATLVALVLGATLIGALAFVARRRRRPLRAE